MLAVHDALANCPDALFSAITWSSTRIWQETVPLSFMPLVTLIYALKNPLTFTSFSQPLVTPESEAD